MIELMKLPFGYEDLEPEMSKETLEYHHDKHHQAYVNKLNELIQGTEFEGAKCCCEILKNLDKAPSDKKQGIINQAGGVHNHNIFWNQFGKKGPKEPADALKEAIEKKFGSFEDFKKEFEKKAIGVFGSGWAWLVKKGNDVEIITTKNQDSPVSEGYVEVIACDVWEHSYYIDYRNKRADYLKNFWNILDWSKIGERFEKAEEHCK